MGGPGFNPEPEFFYPSKNKGKVWQESPPDALIIYNMDAPLENTVYKDCENANGAIAGRFIKPISSTIFGHPK